MPCCVGKVALASSLPQQVMGARSRLLQTVLSRAEYESVAKAGDFGHGKDIADGLAASTIVDRYVMASSLCNPCATMEDPRRDMATSSFTPTPESFNVIDNRRLAKCFLERDRNMSAEESGYRTWMIECWPPTCTPKNDIIVGIPAVSRDIISAFERWIFDPYHIK
jgi:hypothetical protein